MIYISKYNIFDNTYKFWSYFFPNVVFFSMIWEFLFFKICIYQFFLVPLHQKSKEINYGQIQ